MNVSRRGFLWLAGAAGTTTLAGGCASGGLFTGGPAAHDPNLTVFLSDIHVNGQKDGDVFQRSKIMETVAEILKLDPLPSRAVVFGDTVVRVSDKFALAMHIDTDECNAAAAFGTVYGEIVD